MLDPLNALGIAAAVVQLIDFAREILLPFQRIRLALFFFGSWSIWNLEAQALARLDEESVKSFKRSVLDECTMISVSAAIVAQIAITGFSLNFLSQTHWVARALLMFSLTASLMAVRKWIRGRVYEKLELSLTEMFEGRRNLSCDPDKLIPSLHLTEPEPRLSILKYCFRPGIASVLSVSAPQALLSASLISLLIAFGIYLGFTWTRSLDTNASGSDSRNVFIFYITTLFICFLVYSLSSLAQNEDRISEYSVMEKSLDKWLQHNEHVVRSWGNGYQNIISPIVRAASGGDPSVGGAERA
ncbi:hypothetical protein F5882DRAFT_455077 [Hyaloscypha sp. PMI_1271]|nr:hypothetical protein F5882DRAFT_455077 [Hyaloscypha sp. PMI_1271]